MTWRELSCSLGLVLLGLTACGPSLLDRRIEIDKVTPADCTRADALVEEYARAGAVASEVRTVRAHVNTLCASDAYTQGNLDQAEARAKRALDDEPGNSLAQNILEQVTERRKAGAPPPGR
jgi:hypothetical protein